MATIIENTYKNSTVHLDGNTFQRCRMTNCQLIYSGGELPSFIENVIVGCTWLLDDSAARTLIYLKGLHTMTPDVVRGFIAEITSGPSTELPPAEGVH